MKKSVIVPLLLAVVACAPVEQTLSGLWVAWRHGFGGAGVALGLVALFGGALFLSAYLLVESYRCGGDVEKLLLGRRRGGA